MTLDEFKALPHGKKDKLTPDQLKGLRQKYGAKEVNAILFNKEASNNITRVNRMFTAKWRPRRKRAILAKQRHYSRLSERLSTIYN